MLIAHIHLTRTDLAERRKNAFLERFSYESMTNKLTMNYLAKLSLKWAPNDILDICIDMKIRNDSIGMLGEWPVAVFALGKKVLLQSRRQELGLAGLDSIMMMIQIQIQIQEKTNTQVQKVLQI